MCRLRGRDVAFVGQQPSETRRPAGGLGRRASGRTARTTWRRAPRAPAGASRCSRSRRWTADAWSCSRTRRARCSPPGSRARIAARSSSTSRMPGAGPSCSPDDTERASAFYRRVFGWESDAFGDITMWRVPGYVGGKPEQPVPRDVVAGMAPLTPDLLASGVRPHWRIDFWVDDVDATVATATELGGSAIVPPYDTPIARQAVVADPQGAVFSVSRITTGGGSPRAAARTSTSGTQGSGVRPSRATQTSRAERSRARRRRFGRCPAAGPAPLNARS